MIKFGRNYKIMVQDKDGTVLIIQPPFTLELDVIRNTLASACACKLRIYNLNVKTRDSLYFNAYNTSEFKTIEVMAGYGNNLASIFKGNLTQCWSVREGVNFITQIECFSGGFAFVNGDVNISFPKGTLLSTVIATLMTALPNVTIGGIGNFEGTLDKGNTYTGNPADRLFEITGGAFYIDQGKAYARKNNEYFSNIPTTLINYATGLLNTPVLQETIARFEMIFEPTLNLGGLVTVDSETFPGINGYYVITSVKHRGIISPVVSGDLITVGEFSYAKEPIEVEAQ